MKTRFQGLIDVIGLVCILQTAGAFPSDQVKLRLPREESSKSRVSRASQWLVKHMVCGTLENHSELGPLTLVAWHDPSLSPNDKNALAAYAITDSLWSFGHPALFAEHAVYQSLFHYWNGESELAKDRLKSVFASAANPRPAVFWDRERAILVDHVTADEHRRLTAKQATACRQFTFKLALIVYAVRLMKLDVADESILRQMRNALWSAQVESGGLSHFIVTNSEGKNIPSPDATAEATAMAILSETIVPVPTTRSTGGL